MKIIKCKFLDCTDGEYQKIMNAIGVPNEEINNRSYFQHFGFSSIPQAPCVGIGIIYDNQITFFASADPASYRPALSSGETCIYADADKYIKLKTTGEIVIKNNNNTITLKADGDIEIGASNLASLVKDAVLNTLKLHTHPVAGAVANASTDTGMLALDTAPGNKTQNVQAD